MGRTRLREVIVVPIQSVRGPRAMNARFAGRCIHCPRRIAEGDPIYYAGRGQTWHQGCSADMSEEAATASAVRPDRAPAGITSPEENLRNYIAELLMEQGSWEAAWSHICEVNEHWDGEPEP